MYVDSRKYFTTLSINVDTIFVWYIRVFLTTKPDVMAYKLFIISFVNNRYYYFFFRKKILTVISICRYQLFYWSNVNNDDKFHKYFLSHNHTDMIFFLCTHTFIFFWIHTRAVIVRSVSRMICVVDYETFISTVWHAEIDWADKIVTRRIPRTSFKGASVFITYSPTGGVWLLKSSFRRIRPERAGFSRWIHVENKRRAYLANRVRSFSCRWNTRSCCVRSVCTKSTWAQWSPLSWTTVPIGTPDTEKKTKKKKN